MVAAMKIWPILSSGRVATNIWDKDYKDITAKLKKFKTKVGRKVLGVTRRSYSFAQVSDTAVEGELGWITTNDDTDTEVLMAYARVALGPSGTFTRTFLETVYHHATPLPPFLKRVSTLLEELGLDNSNLQPQSYKAAIKAAIHRGARKKWLEKVTARPELRYVFNADSQLTMQHYLTLPSFRGRQALTQFRLDALPTPAPDRGVCPLCFVRTGCLRQHLITRCVIGTRIASKYDQVKAILDSGGLPFTKVSMILLGPGSNQSTTFIH